MDAERVDLKDRVARHAALADAARLRIVDLLGFGDLSPTELGTALAMSSNLLSHHLNVLDEAGLIARTRSEADRRRSYVRLVATAFDHLVPTPTAAVRRVVFVCRANSARSQLAEALWRERSRVPVASAGTHPAEAIHAGALDVARRHGLELVGEPAALTDVLEEGDFLVTVCDVAHENIPADVRAHWSVPDPVRVGSARAFDATYDELARRVDELAPRLTAA